MVICHTAEKIADPLSWKLTFLGRKIEQLKIRKFADLTGKGIYLIYITYLSSEDSNEKNFFHAILSLLDNSLLFSYSTSDLTLSPDDKRKLFFNVNKLINISTQDRE